MGLVVLDVIDELNTILVDTIERTLKVADKYGFDRNELARDVGKHIYEATELSNFNNYKYRDERDGEQHEID